MFRHLTLIAMAAGLVLAVGYADQNKNKLVIPVEKTNAWDGKQMFTSYCAPCHGADARGNGPAARALKSQPTDLTALARLNHGKYPDTHVISVLQFGSEIPAHGSSDMPVWGDILGRMSRLDTVERNLRVANLSRYLEKIQVK